MSSDDEDHDDGSPSDHATETDENNNPSTKVSGADAFAAESPQNEISNGDGAGTEPCFSVEDGSLMHIYESRLRRLRDYESKIGPRYSTSKSNLERSGSATDLGLKQWRAGGSGDSELFAHPVKPDVPEEKAGGKTVALTTTSDANSLPSIINVEDREAGSLEPLDDITLSTEITTSIGLDNTSIKGVGPTFPETMPSDYHFERDTVAEEEKEDIENAGVGRRLTEDPHGGTWGNFTEYSTESSSEKDLKQRNSTDNEKCKNPSEQDANEGYTYLAAMDSKFEAYSMLVDPEQEDRALEITLYSMARPHMRGFHLAWLSFFVAFFTWFAMTPMLGEIELALGIDRKAIWTSSTLAVAGSAVTRVLIGPINDIYGARWTMCCTLLISAVPTALAGVLIHSATSLYIVRLLIGVAGSAFVTCQFWTSSMFTAEVAGTANSLAAGWGNLGGGVAQVVMGSLLFPLFKVIYGGEGYENISQDTDDSTRQRTLSADARDPADRAWRMSLLVPALACICMAYACIRYSDDSPKGNFRKRKSQGLMPVESAKDAIRRGAANSNTWLLFVQYGCCFGVEITMTNAAALYFKEEFDLNTETAAAIASVFGWMNLFARGIGGFCSDMASATLGMRGRLWFQVITLLAEGGLVCVFATSDSLARAVIVMVMFSIFVQAAEGSTFAIVPYVDYVVTGSIAGVVGAGGNVGGVIFSLLFREFDNEEAFRYMGIIVLASSILTAFINVSGHRSLLHGEDAPEVMERRHNHADQLGSLPNVELHGHNSDTNRQRQTVLRVEAPVPQDGSTDTPNSASGEHATETMQDKS